MNGVGQIILVRPNTFLLSAHVLAKDGHQRKIDREIRPLPG